MNTIYVIKANGEREPFNQEKLAASLNHSHLSKSQQSRILERVKDQLYDNIPTQAIHQAVERELQKLSLPSLARYQLKRAIMSLGPTGYPFELFIGELLKHLGYETAVGQLVPGKCVTHEVDVLARKAKQIIFTECKFHNQPGIRSDLKVALYVFARGMDLKERLEAEDRHTSYNSWIFTNTKFSTDAIQYANCVGLKLTGWGYPHDASLERLIDKTGIYPLTVLTSLEAQQINQLINAGIVLVNGLLDRDDLQQLVKLSPEQYTKLKLECLQIVDD